MPCEHQVVFPDALEPFAGVGACRDYRVIARAALPCYRSDPPSRADRPASPTQQAGVRDQIWDIEGRLDPVGHMRYSRH